MRENEKLETLWNKANIGEKEALMDCFVEAIKKNKANNHVFSDKLNEFEKKAETLSRVMKRRFSVLFNEKVNVEFKGIDELIFFDEYIDVEDKDSNTFFVYELGKELNRGRVIVDTDISLAKYIFEKRLGIGKPVISNKRKPHTIIEKRLLGEWVYFEFTSILGTFFDGEAELDYELIGIENDSYNVNIAQPMDKTYKINFDFTVQGVLMNVSMIIPEMTINELEM